MAAKSREKRRRTIQGDLSIGISMVILIATVVLCSIFTYMKSQLDRRALMQHTTIMTENMVTALSGPLWSANDSELDGVAKTYTADNSIVQFTISDFRGDRPYKVSPVSDSDIMRHAEIAKNGEVIGTLAVRFSTKSLDQGRFEWVSSAIALSLVLNILLVLFVRKIIGTVMNPTVDRLSQGLAKVSSGDYDYKLPTSKYLNIEQIYSQINSMAETIRKRELDLSQYNEFLESEKSIALNLLADSVGRIITGFLSSSTMLPYVKATEFINANQDLAFIGPVADQFYSAASQHWHPLNFNVDGKLSTIRTDLTVLNGNIGHFMFYTATVPDSMMTLQLTRLTSVCAEAISRLLANQRASALEANLDRSRVMVNEISRAVHILAHDVRKPFTMISMMFSELERQPSPQAQHHTIAKYMRAVQGSIRLANGLIGDVMALGTMTELSKGTSPLRGIIAESLEIVFSLDSKKSEIEFNYDFAHKFQLFVDKSKIVRAIFNIIENAAQALQYKGTISFFTAQSPDYVILSIANDGPQIPPYVQPLLFEPYYTHGKANGTGLGLAIAKEIVVAHGGDITVTSTASWTSFTLRLPFSVSSSEASAPLTDLPQNTRKLRADNHMQHADEIEEIDNARAHERAEVEGIVAMALEQKALIKMLLIDDESLYLQSVKSEVTNFGIPKTLIEIYEANSPSDALEMIATNAFDLIICDLHLNDSKYDGYNLVTRIRNDGYRKHLIINSNSFGPDIAQRALASGADQFLSKPPSRMQLLKALSTALRISTSLSDDARLTIFLAEDNVLFLEFWQHELRSFNLVTFTSSDACMEALAGGQLKPDLLLTDLYFDDSKANGVDLAQAARSMFHIPVILSTSSSEIADAVLFDLVTDKNLAGVKDFIRDRCKK